MSKQDLEDRNWWRRVGKLIGATLHGWSYRQGASFIDPEVDMTGKVATLLLDQQARIEQLQTANKAAKDFYTTAYQVFGAPLDLACMYGPDFEPPTQDELWAAGQRFLDMQQAAELPGDNQDFCTSCGADIPPRSGEGTCPVCDPDGAKHNPSTSE